MPPRPGCARRSTGSPAWWARCCKMTRLEGDPPRALREDVPLETLFQRTGGRLPRRSRSTRLPPDARCRARASGRKADRELLRRAVENVLRNAIRYAPEGTPIETKLESARSLAMITVRDYGPGVPEDLLPKIFTPFFRVSTLPETTPPAASASAWRSRNARCTCITASCARETWSPDYWSRSSCRWWRRTAIDGARSGLYQPHNCPGTVNC